MQRLPFLLVALPAGVWVDRLRRRPVLIACDVGRAVLLAWPPLAAVLGVLDLTQLLAVGLGVGALTVIFEVARGSYLPSLIGRDRLAEANAATQTSQSISEVAGPSIGGVAVQLLTAPGAVAIDALSCLWSAAWLATIRKREAAPARPSERHLLRELREGMAFVLREPSIRAIAAGTGLTNFFYSIGYAMLLVLLARDLQQQPGVIGLLFSAGSVGGLVAALASGWTIDRLGQGRALWCSVLLAAGAQLLYPLAGRDWRLGLVAAGLFAVTAALTTYNITQITLRQRLCPDHLLGRMNATVRFFIWGTLPLGTLAGGALASWVGVREALVVAGVGTILATVPLLLSPLRTLRGPPAEPAPTVA
jgi:MFS family permease